MPDDQAIGASRRHADQHPSNWDIIYRAGTRYEEMAPCSDFIKMIRYHGVLGGRIRSCYFDRFRRTILNEISLERSRRLLSCSVMFRPNTILFF